MAGRVIIAGLGFIGGSLGISLRRAGWHVAFVDPAVSLDAATERGAADEKLDRIPAAAELTVLATPVDSALAMLPDLDPDLGAITSVCSVMQPLVLAAPVGLRFVAGHPFAGSERSSLAAAKDGLFAGRAWFLDAGIEEPSVDRMVEDCGAIIRRVDPVEHDQALALTSHLPQVISTALGSMIAREGDAPAVFHGTGLESMLRLAGSSFDVWGPVLEANRENLRLPALELARVVHRIIEGEGEEHFRAAQELREKLERNKGRPS